MTDFEHNFDENIKEIFFIMQIKGSEVLNLIMSSWPKSIISVIYSNKKIIIVLLNLKKIIKLKS